MRKGCILSSTLYPSILHKSCWLNPIQIPNYGMSDMDIFPSTIISNFEDIPNEDIGFPLVRPNVDLNNWIFFFISISCASFLTFSKCLERSSHSFLSLSYFISNCDIESTFFETMVGSFMWIQVTFLFTFIYNLSCGIVSISYSLILLNRFILMDLNNN